MEYATGELLARHDWKVDYGVVLALLRPEAQDKEFVVLGAATLGTTRLIDNQEILAP